MGTVHPIRDQSHMALGSAVEAFLVTLDHPESWGTRRVYASTLRALRAEFGDATDTGTLEPGHVAAWFTRQWGQAAPATWNRNLDAIRSAQRYWQDQQWMNATDLTSALRRRQRAADRSRALSSADVGRLLTREDISIRERTLWRLLYETAARSAEVLRLDVEDLDLPNRKAKVRRKGGAIDIIVWQTSTARLLPRLLKGRKTGPVFLTDRRARVQLPPCDIDPASGRARLSYRQAEDLFKAASGGATLHQLPAQRADPRRRSRRVHTDADGQVRAHKRGFAGQVCTPVGRGLGALARAQRPGAAPVRFRPGLRQVSDISRYRRRRARLRWASSVAQLGHGLASP